MAVGISRVASEVVASAASTDSGNCVQVVAAVVVAVAIIIADRRSIINNGTVVILSFVSVRIFLLLLSLLSLRFVWTLSSFQFSSDAVLVATDDRRLL